MDKKVEYYKSKKIYNRLYDKTINKENKNYEKPCLEFTGYKQKNGYGRIGVYNNKKISTHKLSYAIFNNILPECIPEYNDFGEKLEILHGHGCSTSCIEPTHLTIGTHTNKFCPPVSGTCSTINSASTLSSLNKCSEGENNNICDTLYFTSLYITGGTLLSSHFIEILMPLFFIVKLLSLYLKLYIHFKSHFP